MSDDHKPDEWVMQQVQLGRRECLSVLLRRYASRLLTFIHRMVGDRHRSEELFQEVFLAVWQRRGTFESSRPFRPWLFGIAANKCKEHLRNHPDPAVSFEETTVVEESTVDSSPVDTAIATETAMQVKEAVLQLPPLQRAVVVLRIWDQLPYREISEIIGASESTTRSRMMLGLNGIRRYLQARMPS